LSVAAVIAAIGTAATALTVPLVNGWVETRKAEAEAKKLDNLPQVLAALKEDAERQERNAQQLREDVVELRSWIAGYVRANGTQIRDPDPGLPPYPPIEVTRRLKKPSPPLEVQTPLPAPRALQTPETIPDPVITTH
jgi:hypothetical protein